MGSDVNKKAGDGDDILKIDKDSFMKIEEHFRSLCTDIITKVIRETKDKRREKDKEIMNVAISVAMMYVKQLEEIENLKEELDACKTTNPTDTKNSKQRRLERRNAKQCAYEQKERSNQQTKWLNPHYQKLLEQQQKQQEKPEQHHPTNPQKQQQQQPQQPQQNHQQQKKHTPFKQHKQYQQRHENHHQKMKCFTPYYMPYGNNEESGVYSDSVGSASLGSSESFTQTESYNDKKLENYM